MQPFFYTFLKYIRSMFLYNITIITESDSAPEVSSRIRNFMGQIDPATEISRIKFLKMLDSPHEGATYSLQLEVGDQSQIQRFQQIHLQGLQASLEQKFPGKVLYFESVMEYIA